MEHGPSLKARVEGHHVDPPEDLPIQEGGREVSPVDQEMDALTRAAVIAERKATSVPGRARRKMYAYVLGTAIATGLGGAQPVEAGEKTTMAVRLMGNIFGKIGERKQHEQETQQRQLREYQERLMELDQERAEADAKLSAHTERLTRYAQRHAEHTRKGEIAEARALEDEILHLVEVGSRRKRHLDGLDQERVQLVQRMKKAMESVQKAGKWSAVMGQAGELAGRAAWELQVRDWHRSLGLR